MPKKSNAVVLLGMVYPWGAIRHFALLGAELYKACSNDIDFYYASISREPDKGSWDIVREAMPSVYVIEEVAFSALVAHILDLSKEYNNVIVHTGGGWGQTKHFVAGLKNLNKNLRRRIHLIATTHAFRIDSWWRVPMSMVQNVLYRLYYVQVVFQCKYAADRFVGGNHLIKAGKGVVIPLGCEPFGDVSVDPPVELASNSNLLVLLQDDALFKFVYLAAFRPGKMHVWLVQALAPVLQKNKEARILFCGTGDKVVIDDVMSAIREKGLEEQIILPGQIARTEVPWLLAHCQCAVVPSRAETFGHNFLEPMFAGLPVLGTRVGIGRDIIIDGRTGYGFELSNAKSVQEGAEKFLSDRKMAETMGRAAYDLVADKFTHKEVAKQLKTLYDSVLR